MEQTIPRMHRGHEYFMYMFDIRYNTNDYTHLYVTCFNYGFASFNRKCRIASYFLPAFTTIARTNGSHYTFFHGSSYEILDIKSCKCIPPATRIISLFVTSCMFSVWYISRSPHNSNGRSDKRVSERSEKRIRSEKYFLS